MMRKRVSEKTLELNLSSELLAIARHQYPKAYFICPTNRQEWYRGYDAKLGGVRQGNYLVFQYKAPWANFPPNIFSNKDTELRNRASIVSVYLFVEDMIVRGEMSGKEKIIKKFYLNFMSHLRKEVRLGIDATNRFLISYQSRVIQAADSKRSIRDRHEKLKEAFNYYLKSKKIIDYNQ